MASISLANWVLLLKSSVALTVLYTEGGLSEETAQCFDLCRFFLENETKMNYVRYIRAHVRGCSLDEAPGSFRWGSFQITRSFANIRFCQELLFERKSMNRNYRGPRDFFFFRLVYGRGFVLRESHFSSLCCNVTHSSVTDWALSILQRGDDSGNCDPHWADVHISLLLKCCEWERVHGN